MKFKFFVNNEIAFECPINSVRCSAHNSNGARCKRHTELHYYYVCLYRQSILFWSLANVFTFKNYDFHMEGKDCLHLIKQKKIMKLYLKKVL